jgi:hypothetical protein
MGPAVSRKNPMSQGARKAYPARVSAARRERRAAVGGFRAVAGAPVASSMRDTM